MPFRPIILAAMMVVVLGYLGFLSHITDVQVQEQIAAMKADAVKSAHRNITYDLGVNARYGALVAGYEVGWGGGEPEEIEPRVIDFLNERISRGFDYRVVEVSVPRVNDGACEIEFSEDGSYSVSLELGGSVVHVMGGVRASGFEVGKELSTRWKLLYDLVHAEHPGTLLAASTALAHKEDVQEALDVREAELNARYSDEGVVWELKWDGSNVETIARDARAGPIVPVGGKLELMPYRLTTGRAELPEIEVPKPKTRPEPKPVRQPRPASPSNPNFTISISPPSRVIIRGESAEYSVTLTSSGGYSDSISLSVSGLPNGSNAILNPSTIELPSDGSKSSMLKVFTGDSTALGVYELTVTGRGNLTRSASTRLVVREMIGPGGPRVYLIAHDAYTFPGLYASGWYWGLEGTGYFVTTDPDFWRGWTPGASTWPGAERFFKTRIEPQLISDIEPWT